MNEIVVLTESYPSVDEKYANSFVHTRLIEYLKLGIKVKVVNFSTTKNYIYENIEVYSEKNFHFESIDLIISHAPNIKNHFRYIKKHKNKLKNILFFIHGHEVLKVNRYYPQPYNGRFLIGKNMVQNMYDHFKLAYIKKFAKEHSNCKFVFVSEWMKDHFLLNTQLTEQDISNRYKIIHNAAHKIFYDQHYKKNNKGALADFITIRPMSNPKYGVDIVAKIARNNPSYTFHIYGKGDYFELNKIPSNVTVFEKYFTQSQLIDILCKYNAALMPTRLDSQGVMSCEMAVFGIPLLTSDIDICKEMLDGFSNVVFFNNDNLDAIDLNGLLKDITIPEKKIEKFNSKYTVEKEIKYIKEILKF